MAEFQPQWDEKTLRQLIKRYDKNPSSFPEHYKNSLRQHASYHNVPFYEGDFEITDALKDFGSGFLEGFTTIHTGDAPDNEYEAIFRNLGHLAGFAPGIMSAPLGAISKAAKTVGLAGASKSVLTASNMARTLNDYSVPMFAAKHATNFAKKHVGGLAKAGITGSSNATKTASNFLLGGAAKSVAESAFHLGTASAVSSWQGGIDEMMSSFMHGGVAGGVFGALGNVIPGSDAHSKVIRQISGGMFMGLPTTLQGATTPEQVYQYLLGAWFGGQSRPWTVKKAGEFLEEYRKDAEGEGAGAGALRAKYDPEIHPKWKDLPEQVKPVAKELFESTFQTHAKRMAALEYAAKELGVNLEELGIDPGDVKSTVSMLKKVDEHLKRLEEKDINKGSTDDVDFENPISDTIVGKTAERLFNSYMKGATKKISTPSDYDIIKGEIGEKLNTLLSKYVMKQPSGEAGAHKPNYNELYNEIKSTLLNDYNIKLNEKQTDGLQRDVRQWLNRRNTDAPIKQVYYDFNSGKVIDMDIKHPKTGAGNTKYMNEPMKLIDELWNSANQRLWELNGSVGEPPKPERAFAVLDTATVPREYTKEGKKESFNTDKNLHKLGEKELDIVTFNAMKQMYKKGYYYFGGKGTNDRMYFMRMHPDAKNIKTSEIKQFFSLEDFKDIEKAFNNKFPNVGKEYWGNAFKSNVLWALELNGFKYNRTNMQKMLSPGFLLNAIAWNKRNQIWMTDSYPGEKEFYTDPNSPGYINNMSVNGEFKYHIIPDFNEELLDPNYKGNPKRGIPSNETEVGRKKNKEFYDLLKDESKYIDKLSTEMPEYMDGAIIVTDKVLNAMNLDAGTPYSGQNKAFILSPNAEHGALLGKFMFHKAGKALSKQMEESGIHMMMSPSATKQMGTRQFYEEYNLDPTHIRFNYGVKQGEEMLKPQSVKKQVFTNLIESLVTNPKLADGTKMADIVKDMFNEIIEPRFHGTPEANNKLKNYISKLKTASDKELMQELDKIDLENIGFKELLEAINIPGNQLFTEKAYRMMLNGKRKSLIDDLESAEIEKKEYEDGLAELEEYNSLADKIIKIARDVAIEEGRPENQASIFIHPFINKFRMKVISSWVLSQATKPKLNNSGNSRMRPYDIGLQQDLDGVNPRLKDLNKDDSLFFLGDLYRKMEIHTEKDGIAGINTLEEIWQKYENLSGVKKKTDAQKQEMSDLEEIFRSVVMRVPQDSPSGAQVLKFSGFTGREDHGILLHSRAMRKLGGADLDGDSAYFYMGGKGGFKKSWKDMFEAQGKENHEVQTSEITQRKLKRIELIIDDLEQKIGGLYTRDKDMNKVLKPGREKFLKRYQDDIERRKDDHSKVLSAEGKEYLRENKSSEMEDLLVEQFEGTEGKKLKALVDSPTGAFSPNIRMMASSGAIRGRNNLGGAAVSPKNILASAHQMIVDKGGVETVTINGIEYTIRAKTSKAEKDYIRKLTSAMVAFSSDPMEYIGLKSFENWYKKMFLAHFNIAAKAQGKLKTPLIGKKAYDSAGIWGIKKAGSLGIIERANSAYYSKDYKHDRQFTMEERRAMTAELTNIPDNLLNTMTTKIAKLLHPLDYSDNAISRVNQKKVTELFDTYHKAIRKYDYLMKALQRTSFFAKTGKLINRFLDPKLRLWTIEGMEKAVEDPQLFDSIIKGTRFAKLKGIEKYDNIQKIEVLRRAREMASDFLTKNIDVLISVAKIDKYARILKKEGKSDAEINDIISSAHEEVDNLKRASYLMGKERGEATPETEDPITMEVEKGSLEDIIATGMRRAERKDKRVRSRGTVAMDQRAIDNKIRAWKKGKSATEKQLFDILMLGSLGRGNTKRLLELVARKDSLTPKEFEEFEKLSKDEKRTSLSRLGYNSSAIHKDSIKEMISAWTNTFETVSKKRAPEEIRREIKTLTEKPKEKEFIEKGMPEKSTEDIEVTDTTGWEGIVDPKRKTEGLDLETKTYIDDVISYLKTENNKVAQNLNLIVRDLFKKDINLMNKQDWFALRNWFEDVKTGTLWQQMKSFFKGEKQTKLSQRHYMQFPETISRELMKDEIMMIQKKGHFLTKEGIYKLGKVLKPTQAVEILMSDVQNLHGAAIDMGDKIVKKLYEKLSFLDIIPDSAALHEVAVASIRESSYGRQLAANSQGKTVDFMNSKHYKDQSDNILKATDYENSIKNKSYSVTIEGKPVTMKGSDIVKRIQDNYTKFFEEMHVLGRGNVEITKDGNIATYKHPTAKDKNGNPLEIEYIPNSLLNGIDGFTSGKKGEGYIDYSQKLHPSGFYDPITRQNPVIKMNKFIQDAKKALADGKRIPTDFGVDGMNMVARSMMFELAKNSGKWSKEELESMFTSTQKRTGKIDYDKYWPHLHQDKHVALESLKKYIKHIRLSDMEEVEATELINKLSYRHHALTGDWYFEDIDVGKRYDEAMADIGNKKAEKENRINWVNAISKTGSLFSRDAHLPGYSLDRQVPATYAKNIVNTYYRQLTQIFGRETIDRFNKSQLKRGVEKDQREAWSNFLKLYMQGAIGNPDVIPDYILKNPKMKIRGTPYAWWADNKVKDRINKISKTLGLLRKGLPKELEGFDLQDIKHWSNLEAKWELATLLAHPKTMVNNIFGGTMHTIQSVGMGTFMDARNNKLMGALNPEWATPQGRNDMVVRHGIFPEQLMEEYGLHKEYQSQRNNEFMKELSNKVARNPEMGPESVRELIKKHGVTGPIMNWAAKFMSVPERALRRDAFMAHYLHWYRKFGGAIKDFNDPILVELAKKGVKATQFLYNAPARPMFARTALGKVMTRFHLWGWNAVRFRKEALKQARMYGFEGSEADKAARMMQMDLFVFALGNAFAYSLFDVAMPAPWNWMQDTSEWIFGDEKERNRAFFGQWPRAVAPLQLITPPIARMPMASMRAVLEDDWERVANYYVYTMFPFGRIMRDFSPLVKGNLIDNPSGIIEKWSGVPAYGMKKAVKDIKAEDRKVPSPGAGLW